MQYYFENLYDVVNQLGTDSNVEVLPVALAGTRVALIRSKLIPSCAFFVWEDESNNTWSQLGIELPSGDCSRLFSVVCACCASELFGQKVPLVEKAQLCEWRQRLAARYRNALICTCLTYDVNVVFMRHASVWGMRYGADNSVSVVEADECREFLRKQFDGDLVHRALSFIHPTSRGLGGGDTYKEYFQKCL